MEETLKSILNKLKKNILFYTIIYLIIFIILKLIINAFNLEFMKWIKFTTLIILICGFILGIIQLIIKSKNKFVKITLIICFAIILFICMFFCQILGLLYFAYFPPEHIVKKDNKTYVAKVYSWHNTRVLYYDYINFFVMGKNKRIEDFYKDVGRDVLAEDAKDSYNPITTTYYNEDGKIIGID